jgi:hypothetical protein
MVVGKKSAFGEERKEEGDSFFLTNLWLRYERVICIREDARWCDAKRVTI